MMGSLPHNISPGISLSLGDDGCGQVHREHWRLGRWREASPAYFSAQPLGPKLRWHGSTGPPLLSLALQGQKRPRWRHIRQLATRAPAPIPPHHSLKMCPCHKSTKTFVRQLTSLLLQLRTVTAHVRALWVWPRQHQILHVGYSHKTSNTVFKAFLDFLHQEK